MKLEILEGDEYLYEDGKPRNIIIVIDGKRMIIPTVKTIAELCDIVKRTLPLCPSVIMQPTATEILAQGLSEQKPGPQHLCGYCGDTGKIDGHPCICAREKTLSFSTQIEREDIVRCVKVVDSDLKGVDGPTRDIVIGGRYRVLSTKKADIANIDGKVERMTQSYDIIDDAAAIPRRITVYPGEIELVQKAKPRPPVVRKFEMIAACGACGESNALMLESDIDKYVGICTKCGKDITVERPKKDAKQS